MKFIFTQPIFIVLAIFFVIMFVFVVVFPLVQSANKHAENSKSPKLSRKAKIVAKRQHVSGSENSTRTSYYATFEFMDGSREEFSMKAKEYGMLAEDDEGMLNSQGEWFHGFDRLG